MVNADGRDDVALTSGVTGTMREYDLIVALATPQQTEILREKKAEEKGKCFLIYSGFLQLFLSQIQALLKHFQARYSCGMLYIYIQYTLYRYPSIRRVLRSIKC